VCSMSVFGFCGVLCCKRALDMLYSVVCLCDVCCVSVFACGIWFVCVHVIYCV
jgi:hypothetical protein